MSGALVQAQGPGTLAVAVAPATGMETSHSQV